MSSSSNTSASSAPASTTNAAGKTVTVAPKLPVLKGKVDLEGKRAEFYDDLARAYHKRTAVSKYFLDRINKYSDKDSDCTESKVKPFFSKPNVIAVYDVLTNKDQRLPQKGDNLKLSVMNGKQKMEELVLADEKSASRAEVICSSTGRYGDKATRVGWVVVRLKSEVVKHLQSERKDAALELKQVKKTRLNNAKLKKLTKTREALDKTIADLIKAGAVIEPDSPKKEAKTKAKPKAKAAPAPAAADSSSDEKSDAEGEAEKSDSEAEKSDSDSSPPASPAAKSKSKSSTMDTDSD